MKIADLSPTVTPFKAGQTLKASSWSSVDSVDSMGRVRKVYHYGTLMGEYADWGADWEGGWYFSPVSVGIGSATDQKYMNILLAGCGSPVRMFRDKGNPRYSISRTGRSVAVPF